MPLMLVETQLF